MTSNASLRNDVVEEAMSAMDRRAGGMPVDVAFQELFTRKRRGRSRGHRGACHGVAH